MRSNLCDQIDKLENAHQDLKRAWLQEAYDKFEDNGIGSHHNNETKDFFQNSRKDLLLNCRQMTTNIARYIDDCPKIEERYQIFRELYYIHPSFHERWFADEHIAYVTRVLLKGRLGIGVFLSNPDRSPKVMKGISTFVLRRVLLLENLLAGGLTSSLFEESPLTDTELKTKYQKIYGASYTTADDIRERMPDIFQVAHTILERTHYGSLTPEILLSKDKWLLYAPCSINEGPIFHKTSPKTRVEIFSSITTTDVEELREYLRQHFEIQPVRYDALNENEGTSGQLRQPLFFSENYSSSGEIPLRPQPVTSSRARSQLSPVTEAFHEEYARKNGVERQFSDIFTSCTKLFPSYTVMRRSIHFRVKNVLGYTKIDAFNVIPRQSDPVHGLKFQAYIHVLRAYFGGTIEDVKQALPSHSEAWSWQNKDTPDATGLQGFFRTHEEVSEFIKYLRSGRDPLFLPSDRTGK